MKIEFTIPLRTASEMNGIKRKVKVNGKIVNKNEHWSQKSKRHRLHKIIIKSYCNTRNVDESLLPCLVKLIRIAPRKMDFDCLVGSFKWIRDAVAESLIKGLAIGRADGDPRIQWYYNQERGEPKQYALRIEIISKYLDDVSIMSPEEVWAKSVGDKM